MKTYVSDNQLRLVGKAYEIRHYLRAAKKREAFGQTPMSQWIQSEKSRRGFRR
ncbi:Z-ring formation inhibitor MciZ [Ferviditalea candida]|uniref:Z-ring formation inhibitor MciZ n=1 Tax=Ferviditalea candida TaxID=3108399 RepID=A0ABU5ZJQ4_9BACL|nr:Z-ring formation inhibitor MciZ [Paenibacillaceae bacterium T2]